MCDLECPATEPQTAAPKAINIKQRGVSRITKLALAVTGSALLLLVTASGWIAFATSKGNQPRLAANVTVSAKLSSFGKLESPALAAQPTVKQTLKMMADDDDTDASAFYVQVDLSAGADDEGHVLRVGRMANGLKLASIRTLDNIRLLSFTDDREYRFEGGKLASCGGPIREVDGLSRLTDIDPQPNETGLEGGAHATLGEPPVGWFPSLPSSAECAAVAAETARLDEARALLPIMERPTLGNQSSSSARGRKLGRGTPGYCTLQTTNRNQRCLGATLTNDKTGERGSNGDVAVCKMRCTDDPNCAHFSFFKTGGWGWCMTHAACGEMGETEDNEIDHYVCTDQDDDVKFYVDVPESWDKRMAQGAMILLSRRGSPYRKEILHGDNLLNHLWQDENQDGWSSGVRTKAGARVKTGRCLKQSYYWYYTFKIEYCDEWEYKDTSKQCFFGFHDTDDAGDIIANIDYGEVGMETRTGATRYVMGGVLDKFYDALDSGLEALIDGTKPGETPCDEVYFSGCSLGGGIATVAQAYFDDYLNRDAGSVFTTAAIKAFGESDKGDPVPGVRVFHISDPIGGNFLTFNGLDAAAVGTVSFLVPFTRLATATAERLAAQQRALKHHVASSVKLIHGEEGRRAFIRTRDAHGDEEPWDARPYELAFHKENRQGFNNAYFHHAGIHNCDTPPREKQGGRAIIDKWWIGPWNKGEEVDPARTCKSDASALDWSRTGIDKYWYGGHVCQPGHNCQFCEKTFYSAIGVAGHCVDCAAHSHCGSGQYCGDPLDNDKVCVAKKPTWDGREGYVGWTAGAKCQSGQEINGYCHNGPGTLPPGTDVGWDWGKDSGQYCQPMGRSRGVEHDGKCLGQCWGRGSKVGVGAGYKWCCSLSSYWDWWSWSAKCS